MRWSGLCAEPESWECASGSAIRHQRIKNGGESAYSHLQGALQGEHYRPDGDGELAEATQSQSLMWAFQSYKSGIYQQFLPSDPTAQTAGTFTAGNARHEAHIKHGAKRTQSASVWGFLKPLELLA